MHYSVLLSESIEGLNIQENGIYVDGTLGYGGHSEEILKRLTNGHLYAFDNDIEAIEYSRKRLDKYKDKVTFIHSNFENLKEKLEEVNVSTIDGIVLDLGFSSPQIDDPNRGFSFMKDARLDMRMDKSQKISAYEVVNEYKEEKLTEIFYKYAEEKFSRVIAKNIVARRPIESTMELVDVIKSSVNRELIVLEKVLPDAIEMLNIGGRISVITFHSLEDRIVKQTFKKASEVDKLVSGLPVIPEEYKPKIKLINKKPILPSDIELQENTRSKSAKLRIIERV